MTEWNKEFAWLPTQIGNRKVWFGWYAWRKLDRWEHEEPEKPLEMPAYRSGDTANDIVRRETLSLHFTMSMIKLNSSILGITEWREYSLPDGYLVWGNRLCTPYGCCTWKWVGCDD